MDAPQLVLVPPTPLSYSIPSPISPITASADHPKRSSSSDTAIVSIYSMYGDHDAHNAWTPSAFDPVVKRKKSNRLGVVHPKTTISPPQTYPRPLPVPSGLPPHESSCHSGQSDTHQDLLLSNKPVTSIMEDDNQQTATESTNAHIPLPLESRAKSNHSASSSVQTTFETASVGRSSNDSRRDSTLAAPLNSNADIGPRPRSRSPRKRPPEAPRKSVFANMELPPVPMSSDHLAPSRPETPRKTPPSSRPATPQKTPMSSRNVSRTTSPSGKVSLGLSRGEDADASFVRSTYALLDAQGVKGDGYEEGVERTRAKIGSNPASQRDADRAIADEREKKRELTSQEVTMLASLDRYGFFTIPSHDRLVLLPSAPLRKRLTGPTPTPRSASTAAKSLPSLPPVCLPSKEYQRISKWDRMLIPSRRDLGGNIESWTIRASKQSKFRRRVYKGIPDRWRTAVWDMLMSRYARSGTRDLEKYAVEYREATDKPSNYDIQIDLDVPRTISGHVLFHTRYGAGQRSLFRVLHSFSLRCSECGYVQGMGPIAATLLCYAEPERVYGSLVRLHDAYDLHRVFSPGFPGLLEAIFVQERLTRATMPAVYAAFARHTVSTTAYATKWYITLFANSVPFQTQLRLWDAFLLDGPDVFIAMAVAIVWVYRDQITSHSANFETVLSLLSSFFVPEDEDELLSWIGKTLGNRKLRSRMGQWRTEWRNLVSRGEDAKALL